MTASSLPKPPKGTGVAGRALWRAVLADFELATHEVALLTQACHSADLCAHLQEVVDKEGAMLEDERRGTRTHPALVELRQQRLVLARLIVALRVPIGDAETDPSKHAGARLQRRGGVRGVYGIRGGVA